MTTYQEDRAHFRAQSEAAERELHKPSRTELLAEWEEKVQSVDRSVVKPIGGSNAYIERARENATKWAHEQPSADHEAAARAERIAKADRDWAAAFPDLYVEEVEAIEAGKLEQAEWFAAFSKAWANRADPRLGAILVAVSGAGKSDVGTWAGRHEWRQGRPGVYLSALELPGLIDLRRAGKWRKLRDARRAGFLFLDEIADLAEAPWSVFAELKAIITTRYAHRLPTILGSTDGVDTLEAAFGAEVINRFPEGLRFETSQGSMRRE